ncbi:hypothetical protein BSU04_41475 [Caballeronia sordidicola]|jgi:hypothetical protein|uniref:Uncharacterized protein n=1 Tax=Caballeronia sordidicola TaxID=196367 RepID=A0A226WP90_CABSO|nr:hypothetical protein BSU04_41475 [Caballeronia sordidicola]
MPPGKGEDKSRTARVSPLAHPVINADTPTPDRFASGGIAANFHGSPYNLRKLNYRFPNPC